MPGRRKAQKAEEEQPQQAPAKTQPISKPKKFLKKSIDALQRIERSKHDRIFLLSAQRNQEQWGFEVMGKSGSHYHVKVSTTVACTCPDFRIKKKPCKHIFFIVTQVAQNEETLDYFRSTVAKLSKAAYEILDKQLTERLRSRMQAQKSSTDTAIDLKDDTDCVICFTEMDTHNEQLQGCPTCKKYFHSSCLSQWKKHNTTCPLCRSELSKTDKDPLGQLKDIKL